MGLTRDVAGTTASCRNINVIYGTPLLWLLPAHNCPPCIIVCFFFCILALRGSLELHHGNMDGGRVASRVNSSLEIVRDDRAAAETPVHIREDNDARSDVAFKRFAAGGEGLHKVSGYPGGCAFSNGHGWNGKRVNNLRLNSYRCYGRKRSVRP